MVIEKYVFGAVFIAERSVLVRKSVIIRVIDIILFLQLMPSGNTMQNLENGCCLRSVAVGNSMG